MFAPSKNLFINAPPLSRCVLLAVAPLFSVNSPLFQDDFVREHQRTGTGRRRGMSGDRGVLNGEVRFFADPVGACRPVVGRGYGGFARTPAVRGVGDRKLDPHASIISQKGSPERNEVAAPGRQDRRRRGLVNSGCHHGCKS
jgi:hypothetical protein